MFFNQNGMFETKMKKCSKVKTIHTMALSHWFGFLLLTLQSDPVRLKHNTSFFFPCCVRDSHSHPQDL